MRCSPQIKGRVDAVHLQLVCLNARAVRVRSDASARHFVSEPAPHANEALMIGVLQLEAVGQAGIQGACARTSLPAAAF